MNSLQPVLLLISITQSASEVINRAKRAAIEPFQPLVGATIAAAVNVTEAVTDDPIVKGTLSGTTKAVILGGCVVFLGVFLSLSFAWSMRPKGNPMERNPLLEGHRPVSRCGSNK